MPDGKKKESKKRCPDCGGTGLRADEKKGTEICYCVAGARREMAVEGWD